MLGLLIGCLGIGSAAAHHGHGAYDTLAIVKLNGKVVDFELLDPHSLLYVDVTEDDGSVTSWVIEGGAAYGIVRAGLTKASLARGPTVTVRANPSKDGLCRPLCRGLGQSFEFQHLPPGQHDAD